MQMSLTRQERLARWDSRPRFVVGFNYHPSTSGCQYWRQWDAEQIERDLRAMAQRGFNVVRFFVFWADFELRPGWYEPIMVERLRAFVRLAHASGLYCIPALLTIWMNGQLFDLPWRQGRDLWADTEMVDRERSYVAHLAAALSDAVNILAYDLGDEIIHVDIGSVGRLTAEQVVGWQTTLADAIRAAHPGSLVLQGQELSSVLGSHAFRPEHSRALDLLAIHGYPTWTPFAIESIASYKASMLVPFLVQMARLDGPVVVDEFGSYGADVEVGSGYIRATIHSALANGARGLIAWCWQDFASCDPPYAAHPGERAVGFLDVAGDPKPMMPTFEQFARRVKQEWAELQPAPAPIGIYVAPQADRAHSSYLHHGESTRAASFSAFLLLKRAHLPCEFTRGPLHRYRLVICPSMERLSWPEKCMLEEYVTQGGVLYYSAGSYLHGFGGEDLFGIRLRDFTLRAEEMTGFCWRDQTYPVSWARPGQPLPQIPIIRATSARVLATFPNGTPALTSIQRGTGSAYYLNAPLERFLDQPGALDADAWHLLYSHVAELAGIERVLDCDHPEIEVAVARDHGSCYAFIINHSPQAVRARLTSAHVNVAAHLYAHQGVLEGKEVRVVAWQDIDWSDPQEASDDR